MNATERSLNVEGQRAGNSDTDPTASAPGAEVLARWKAAWSEPETSLPEKPQKPAVEDDLGEVPTPAELFAAQSDVVALLARPTLAPASGKSEEAPKPSLAAARVTESSVGGANLPTSAFRR